MKLSHCWSFFTNEQYGLRSGNGRKSILLVKYSVRDSRIANYYYIGLNIRYFTMKKHSGMRPHDIVILLKIAAKGNQNWLMKNLAIELGISAGEVSESINRSVQAGLLAKDKKTVMKAALLEFLRYGLPYVFPQQPGALVRGIPTAHSAPPLDKLIQSNELYVWPSAKGNARGQAIEPLYSTVVIAIEKDNKLYELLALVDALRVGRVREKQLAMEELKKRLM